MEIIPKIGLGTWKSKGEDCYRIVRTALDVGYEHIDTAWVYENEGEIGKALRDSGISREKYWLTSKLWIDDFGAKTRDAFERSLKLLGVEYLDLYLMHWPHKASNYEDHHETLEELLNLKSEGKIKHIGVSNFPCSLLQDALDYVPGEIFVNQVEYHVNLDQSKVLNMCREHGLILEAYSPLGHGHIFKSENMQKIAEKHNKNIAQIALKWLVQQDGVVALPKASSEEHLKSNLDIFDFELDAEDLEIISKLPKNYRYCDFDFLKPQWDS